MIRTFSRTGLLATLASTAIALPAHAHHAMGGMTPTTFTEGLLSGLAHPVIGPDHLAFVLAIGIAAALLASGPALISAFIAASTAGVLAHIASLNLPMSETMVAASVIVAGVVIALGRGIGQPLWLGLAVVAGLFHGYAFGESVVGAERGAIGAYLIGLAFVMSVVALAAMTLTRAMVGAEGESSARLRTAGAAIGGVGAVMLTLSLVG